MNTELKRIPFESIIPNEKNPRDDFSSVGRLAANLAAMSSIYNGEPVNPIILMKDGDKYRIIDGERRFRAMKLNGLTECNAFVCESWSDADQLLAAFATDDKEPLSAIARSRGLQEFMDLGILDGPKIDAIEAVANVERGTFEELATARARAGEERAHNATIDQLLAAEQFAAYPETYNAVLSAGTEWPQVANKARKQVRMAAQCETLTEAVESMGFEVVDPDEIPEGYRIFAHREKHPEYVKEILKDCDPETTVCVINASTERDATVSFFAYHEEPTNPIDEERARKKAEHDDIYASGQYRRAAWLVSKFDDESYSLPHIAKEAEGYMGNYWMLINALSRMDQYGLEFAQPATWEDALCWLTHMDNLPLMSYDGTLDLERCSDYASLLEALEADGYAPEESEIELYNQAIEVINGRNE